MAIINVFEGEREIKVDKKKKKEFKPGLRCILCFNTESVSSFLAAKKNVFSRTQTPSEIMCACVHA